MDLPRVPHERPHPDGPRILEANTQAEFYHQARLAHLPLLLEVVTPCGRLDIAILRPDQSGIVAIVEVKRQGRTIYGESRQIQRYKMIGVPVYGLNTPDNAARLVATISRKHRLDKGISWAAIKAIEPMKRRDFWRKPDKTRIEY